MDEVPIATNNPVKPIKPKSDTNKKPKKKSPVLESLKNFVFMFPLACLIFYQVYLLGQSFGEFITFPPTSIITYIFIGSILLIFLVIQTLMRSILYSLGVGIFFVAGVFSSWFGSVYEPIICNLSSIVDIVQSAWSRKNIPFQLLVTGSLSGVFVAVVFIQFMASLIVKSFFEMIFGRNWGDGHWMGYLGAIALIFGLQISFNSYNKYSNDNRTKQIWKSVQLYEPMEKFITRTADSFTYNDSYVWANLGHKVKSLKISDGVAVSSLNIESPMLTKGFQEAIIPVIAANDKFIGYNESLNSIAWEISYPDMTASDVAYTNSEDKELRQLQPLTIKYIDNGRKFIAFYDYGKIGMYDMEKGKELWVNRLDQPVIHTRMFPDKYLDDISFIEYGENVIFCCQNGIVKSINVKSGVQNWEYVHTVSKIGGKAQRGIITKDGDNIAVAFKTGEIVTLGVNDGHLIYKVAKEAFNINSELVCEDSKAFFITEDGLFYEVELNGGKIVNRINGIPNKSDIYPQIFDIKNKIVAHRDKIYKIDTDKGTACVIYTCKNRVFITKPVFDGKYMFIGTQDGWIFNFHIGSESVKYVVHANGELNEDSLKLAGKKQNCLSKM